MLELLLLSSLCRRIGRTAAGKSRRRWPYQLLLIGVWFGSQFLGCLIALAILGREELPMGYLCGLATAMIGAIATYWGVGRRTSLVDASVTEVFE